MASEFQLGGYRMLKLMTQGQTSQVWEAVEASSGRHFAIKLLLPENVTVAVHRQFLFHEAEVGMGLRHPNVVRVVNLIRDKKNPYFVMEYFPGGNLEMRLKQQMDFVKEHAHWIIEQAAMGLAHLHDKGWVHRDIKPANILCNTSSEVRVIDFALAKRIQRSNGLFGRLFKKKSDKAQGTRSYMSPEQIRNDFLDERADLYSFGATMYEVVTGRPPFRGNTPNDLLKKHLTEKVVTPQAHNANVTDDCAKLIMRLLAKERKERIANFHEFLSTWRTTRVFKGDKLVPRRKPQGT